MTGAFDIGSKHQAHMLNIKYLNKYCFEFFKILKFQTAPPPCGNWRPWIHTGGPVTRKSVDKIFVDLLKICNGNPKEDPNDPILSCTPKQALCLGVLNTKEISICRDTEVICKGSGILLEIWQGPSWNLSFSNVEMKITLTGGYRWKWIAVGFTNVEDTDDTSVMNVRPYSY
jgi:hypothetical protein